METQKLNPDFEKLNTFN